MNNEVSDKDFLKNVCYIKHFYLTLHSIIDNYGKEYIRKDDAEGNRLCWHESAGICLCRTLQTGQR